MIRVEVIANQSIQDDLTDALAQEIPEIEYTIIPEVLGKGRTTKKLGDTIWPEMNFCLFTYVDEAAAKKIKLIMNALIQKFPNEGISFFYSQAVEI